jgi:hypothetical protein
VVFSAAAADPTSELLAGGRYSFDNGSSWATAGGAAFYEQHIDLKPDRLFWTAMQYDVDLLHKAPAATMCYELDVTDASTGAVAELDGCLPLCTKLVPFHDKDGYCGGTRYTV